MTKIKTRYQKRQELINAYKKAKGRCEDCGYNKYWEILTFHHLKPSEKHFDLSGRHLSNKSIDNILKEIQKCILLCPNCHSLKHKDNIIVKKSWIDKIKGWYK